MIMETREEMFNYIFDMLEDLDIVKWTKMYNRQLILEAFSQIDVEPYVYCNKKSHSFSKAIKRIFDKSNVFNSYKGTRESWNVFLLRLIGYKKCCGCNKTILTNNFNNNKQNPSGLNSECKHCKSEKYIENKEQINKDNNIRHNKNKEKVQQNRLTNKIYIVNELGGCCHTCGYDNNYAALDIHHKNTKIKRFSWTIDKYGKNKQPSTYLMNITKELMIERFNIEKDNLQVLCRNCHQKHESPQQTKNNTKEVIEELGYDYICKIENCMEEIHLHLHHNEKNEKVVSFGYFSAQSKQKILKEGLLEKEMKKDVSILCGNHHREIHNPVFNKEE